MSTEFNLIGQSFVRIVAVRDKATRLRKQLYGASESKRSLL